MLTVEEARKRALEYMNADHEGGPYAMRSCWNCNSSHDYLKKAEYPILCFACGHWYFNGVDITEGAPEGKEPAR